MWHSGKTCPLPNLFCGCFCLGSCAFVGLVCCFLTKCKSGWGICGSSYCFVWFLVGCDLPALLDLVGPWTNVVLTAYAQVRTEPQCDIGHTRGKNKKIWTVVSMHAMHLCALCSSVHDEDIRLSQCVNICVHSSRYGICYHKRK